MWPTLPSRAGTFGFDLFPECITNTSTYPRGSWELLLITGSTELRLNDLAALRAIGVEIPNDPRFTGFRYEPERACLAACLAALGPQCQQFTYDGLSKDSYVSHVDR
jgi:hypothetical protein